MQNMPIAIFRGDDTDALGYQTIVGTIKTDLDLAGCKAVFRYLSFSAEFDPIPEDKKLTVIIPASETKKFPPGLGYASLRVYDAEGKLCTFSNRIMVFVATKTPMFGNEEFEVDFNVRPELEPLKIFVGPNPDDFDEYRGFLEKVIDRASAEKYGLAMLLDAIDSDLGADDGVAATPVAVKAAYAAIIKKLTDDYYTKDETDEAIDRVAAYYITYDAAGNPFPTYAALASAQTVYSGGQVRTPTRNDYCVVLADETHQGAEYRYIYAVAEGQTTGSWQPQFPVEGVMTIDQTVTKDSQNPVASSGIWSAIWGALTALPGFSSIYDWCVATFRNKTDLNVYDDSSRVWTISNCTAPGLGNAINGRYVYSASEQKWLKDGVTDFYIYRDDGQWVLFVRMQGDLPVWMTDSAQGVSGTLSMMGGMTARYTIDVATSWEATDTLAKSSELPVASDTDPVMDGTAGPGSSDAFARGDHVHPTDTSRMAASATGADIPVDATPGAQKIDAALAGKATKADATLTAVYADEWAFTVSLSDEVKAALYAENSASAENNYALTITDDDLYVGGYLVANVNSDELQKEIERVRSAALQQVWNIGDTVATRVSVTDHVEVYQLGSQSTKPLATAAQGVKADAALPATNVVAPSTSASDSGKAADAKATGDALAGKQSALSAQQLANIAAVSDALAFDATHTYAAGDPVVYDGTLYTFTATHTGAWTGSDVSAVDIIERLAGKANRAPNPTAGNLAALDASGNPTDAGWTAGELARYSLVAKTIDNGAVTLDDRAINAVAVSSSLASLTVNFPTATSGKARDFGLRLTVASGITTAPQIVLPQGVTCENADGEAPEIGADGAATILYFTETDSGVFLVKGEVLQTITA